jgi:predicted AAA+ superfamily ATPase
VKCFANLGEQPGISYLRTNNNLEVDLIIAGPNNRPLPVEIKLSRTPTASLASGITRYRALFAEENPEDGFLLCLADGERPLNRGITAIGIKEYLSMLHKHLAS